MWLLTLFSAANLLELLGTLLLIIIFISQEKRDKKWIQQRQKLYLTRKSR